MAALGRILRDNALAAGLLLLALSLGLPRQARGAEFASGALKAIWGPGVERGTSHFPVYRDLGIRIYEDKLVWSQIASTKPRHPADPHDPAYRWPVEVDQAVREARRYHMKVALQIIGAPRWANGGKPSNWAPKSAYDYARFATAAARRYGSVHLWMIWGEPSRSHNFNPLIKAPRFAHLNPLQQVAPHLYARLVDAAYGALKAVSRANLVIGGMTYTTGEISPQQWIENLKLPDGKPPRMDMYGHNPFSYRDPDLASPPSAEQNVDFSDLGRFSQLVNRYLGRPLRKRLKLFISEWTVPTAIDQEFNFYVDPSVQARWIADSLRIGRQLRSIYAIGWIHLYDEPPVTYGGLLTAGGTKKPGYFAWKQG
jgi:hypothetical protein